VKGKGSRKDDKVKVLLSGDLKQRVTTVGDRLGLSLSSAIRLALSEFVERQEGK
jgi:antitoxin component of RelBE/YafQ-DinJ toxin-antitoxin module